MKKYMVYMDDGRDCFKVAVPANNEKAARKYVEGNGEVIAVKDITEDFPISLDKVAQALKMHSSDRLKLILSQGVYPLMILQNKKGGGTNERNQLEARN